MTKGRMLQADRPDWAPLLAIAGEPLAHQFMWMHEVQLRDGRRLQAFKHIATRRYLHVDGGSGQGWRYITPDNYVVADLAELLTEALAPMWDDGPDCEPGWADTARAAIAAVRSRMAA